MKSLEIYLTFNGNCREAIEHYAKVFDGEITIMNTFAEMPADPEHPMPDALKDQIMHCTLQLKPGVILMASDTMEGDVSQGNNFTISVVPDSKEEVETLCAALSEGGEVTMLPADTFWGAYFAMCRDKFGINWMFNYGTEE
ncbi:MAG: VOC family protein [Pseudomonadales bacterium]|nr:VOC family protein [Pseudomonadales bacterium]